MPARRLLIRGEVQGVGYRWWAARQARALGLTGWVRNLSDGRVECWAEGPDAALAALVQACGEGPASAEVVAVDVTIVEARGHTRFERAPDAHTPLALSDPDPAS